jgi:hypothetical protein
MVDLRWQVTGGSTHFHKRYQRTISKGTVRHEQLATKRAAHERAQVVGHSHRRERCVSTVRILRARRNIAERCQRARCASPINLC